MTSRYLLDTGVLLGFLRKAAWAARTRQEFNLGGYETIVFTSVVCVGELLALAEKRGWGERKRSQLEEVLASFPALDINDPGTLHAYARIDAWSRGKKVAAPNRAPPLKPAASMAQNDLWIAATAHESQAILLSTDRDFERLDGIWFEYHYVNQSR